MEVPVTSAHMLDLVRSRMTGDLTLSLEVLLEILAGRTVLGDRPRPRASWARGLPRRRAGLDLVP